MGDFPELARIRLVAVPARAHDPDRDRPLPDGAFDEAQDAVVRRYIAIDPMIRSHGPDSGPKVEGFSFGG